MEAMNDGKKLQLEILVAELDREVKSFNPASGPEGVKSRVEIVAKAKEIVNAVMDPSQFCLNQLINLLEGMAIRTLLNFKIPQNMPDTGSISLLDLSKATGVQGSLLERLLHIVVGTGFINQTPELEYYHTKFSRAYTRVPGPAVFFELMYDDVVLVLDRFHEYLEERNMLTEPNQQNFNPYTWAHNQDGTSVWDILAQTPDKLKKFHLGLASTQDTASVATFYDFSKLSTLDDRPVLVDVGGGNGRSILEIMKAYPVLSRSPEKFVLEDLKDTIEEVSQKRELPANVKKVVHSFFDEQPIKGAKAYFLRHIMHDYSDALCVQILKRQADAMSADSLLLIVESVLPERCSLAKLETAAMDLCMMAMGGKERTEAAFERMLQEAGFELVKVWKSSICKNTVIEAKLAGARADA